MALNMKYMNLKRIITKKNYFGDERTVTDLTEPTLKPDYKSKSFMITRTVTVNDEYAMRPDLISYFAYGTDQYADIIMKFNGISNPFAINEGMLLFIPKMPDAKKFYRAPKASKKEIEEVRRSFIDKNRFTKPTERRLKKLQQLAASKKNGSPTIAPSNKLKPGESATSTKGGALIFAEYKSKQSKASTKTSKK